MINDQTILNDWYVVARSTEILRGELYNTTLLEEKVLLWRAADGQVKAWRDRCPHRGAALSLGRVLDNDVIACPYHGWQFDKTAQCIKMPAHPQRVIPERIRIPVYQARERYGFVWLSLGRPEHDIAALAEPADPAYYNHLFGPFQFDSSPGRAIENFLDMAHFPFVHPGLLGEEPYTEVKDYEVESSPEGIVAKNCFFPQPHGASHIKGMSDINYTYKVLRPYTAYLLKHLEGRQYNDAMLLAATPLTEESCAVWAIWSQHYGDEDGDNKNTMLISKAESEQWTLKIILQDLPIVNSQQPKRLPLTLTDEFHQPCDRIALAYRRWLDERGVRYGTIPAKTH